MCFWGQFKQPGKAEGQGGWEMRPLNWAGARLVMTLYITMIMMLAVVIVEEDAVNNTRSNVSPYNIHIMSIRITYTIKITAI